MFKTANEELFDALVRHQTYLLRYSASLSNELIKILNRSEEQTVDLIKKMLADGRGLRGPAEVRRLAGLFKKVKKVRSGAWRDVSKVAIKEAETLAKDESSIFAGMLGTFSLFALKLLAPKKKKLNLIVSVYQFQGRTLNEWLQNAESEDFRKISATMQAGIVAGESVAEIVKRVVGTKALDGKDGIVQGSRNGIDSIIKTAVQHITSNARAEVLNENDKLILAEQYVAVLDNRTTPLCRSLSNKIFAIGEGPMPPLHFYCRSMRVPFFTKENLINQELKTSTNENLVKEYAERENLGYITKREDLPHGSKTKFDKFLSQRVLELLGGAPSAASYSDWLKRQSVSFQNDTLGIIKAKLFREGGLTLDKFVMANGTELTLKQLAKKYTDAFIKAGFDPKDFI